MVRPGRGQGVRPFCKIWSEKRAGESEVQDTEGNKGRSSPYIEGNPSTAFAARLLPQYESHICLTKETIQFVANPVKEIPHNTRVTKERTPKLSQQVFHQVTARDREAAVRAHSST